MAGQRDHAKHNPAEAPVRGCGANDGHVKVGKPKLTDRRWVVYGLPAAAVVILVGGVALAWLLTPPAMPEDAAAALEVLASPRFARLDDAQKQRYHDRIGELFRDMDDDARQAFREQMRTDSDLREQLRNMMRDRMREQARRFATATPQERLAMLDQMIDRREQWGGGRGEGPPQDGREPRGPRGDPRDRAADRFEQGNPQDQALMGEFFRALRLRSQQRGGEPR